MIVKRPTSFMLAACWYIFLEGGVPLLGRLKCVISTKNID